MEITKDTKIQALLADRKGFSRVLIENGINAVQINKNLLNTLEQTVTGSGMPNGLLQKIVRQLNEKAKEPSHEKERKSYEKPVSVTSLAAEKIKEMMASKGLKDYALKFSIQSAGCSAYIYDMDFEKKPTRNEIVVEDNGVKILVNKKSLKLLDGTEIDYVPQSGGFKINNPNVKSD